MLWVLLGLGVFLRVFHYVDNRSLWLDEIYLASSLVNMDFAGLVLSDLEYQQKAPLGFLLLCKVAVLILGKSEMALRFVPLVCGLLSLFLFQSVCKYFLKLPGVTVAVGILALAPPLVYHTVEIKQYSTELLASILCLYLYTRFHRRQEISSLVLWGCWGALIIWFSFASIFVLAGMAMGIFLYHLSRKEWKILLRLSLPFLMWGCSFAVNYLLFTYKHADSAWLIHYFKIRSGFMPFPPESVRDLLWPIRKGGNRLIRFPLGLLWEVPETATGFWVYFLKKPLIPLICIGTGLLLLLKKDRKFLLVLLLPYFLAVAASALEKYPLYERLTVFLAPLLILIVAVGCERVIQMLQPVNKKAAVLFSLLLLGAPFWTSAKQIIDPSLFGGFKKAYYREALLLINNQFKEGDAVYVYWNMVTPYRFYKQTYGLTYDASVGSDVRGISRNSAEYFTRLGPEIKSAGTGKRVWLLYSKNRGVKIGEFDQQPAWYFREVIGGEKLYQKFAALGKEIYVYDAPELKVCLFEIPSQ